MSKRLHLVDSSLAKDPELRAEHAQASMAALEFVFESVPGEVMVPSAHVHVLLGLLGGAVRGCPCADQFRCDAPHD